MQRRLAEQNAKQDKAVAEAEAKAKGNGKAEKDNKDEKDSKAEDAAVKKKIEAAKTNAKKPFIAQISALTKAENALKGHQAFAAEDYKTAYDLMKKAGDEDASSLARVRYLSGQKNEAETDLRNLVSRSQHEVLPLAYPDRRALAAGERKTRRPRYSSELRKTSGSIDLDSPVFTRLAPVAASLNLPADWRLPRDMPTDVGDRPELDSLGPFRWQPSPRRSGRSRTRKATSIRSATGTASRWW